jgi:D-mannonate dehydratase
LTKLVGVMAERLLDIVPSHYNTCEFCQGTISEMIENDEGMYDAITQYASQDKISYVHFRVRQQHLSSGPLIDR